MTNDREPKRGSDAAALIEEARTAVHQIDNHQRPGTGATVHLLCRLADALESATAGAVPPDVLREQREAIGAALAFLESQDGYSPTIVVTNEAYEVRTLTDLSQFGVDGSSGGATIDSATFTGPTLFDAVLAAMEECDDESATRIRVLAAREAKPE